MWFIRVTRLFTEVGGLISGAEVKFKAPEGHEHTVEGKLIRPEDVYHFSVPGPRGVLTVEHGDRVVVDFEVLNITDDDEQPAKAEEPTQ